jgi:hypothetical protein
MLPPILSEQLLQFIWLRKYFNSKNLLTTDGQTVQIDFCGEWNTTNEGPDFKNAKITIDKTHWHGNVEIHLTTKQWLQHQHQKNKHYQNVVLHVVYHNDTHENPSNIPVLEIKNYIPHSLLEQYEKLLQTKNNIACSNSFSQVNELTKNIWYEKLFVSRLIEKTEKILVDINNNQEHWEEVFWWYIARNFGLLVNAEPFEQIAKSIPINIIYKHKNNIIQLEALLMGQAGLLKETYNDHYAQLLLREYNYLRKKWQLIPTNTPISYLRMRPANFPTIRLSQLAALIEKSSFLLSQIRSIDKLNEVIKLLKVSANDYWQYHYQFDEAQEAKKEKILGRTTINAICINTIIPFLYAWGKYYNETALQDKAIQWLQELPAENNSITEQWDTLGWQASNAAYSQAQVYLYKNYCLPKKCLQCSIGNAILK